jgi:serine protease AprX
MLGLRTSRTDLELSMDARRTRSTRRRSVHAVGLTLSATLVAGMAAAPVGATDRAMVSVIVDGAALQAAAAVERLGGVVDDRLEIVDGLTATVPASALSALAAVPGVRSVTPDSTLVSLGTLWGDDTTEQGLLSTLLFGEWRADGDLNSAYSITQQTGAQAVWDMADPNRAGGRLTGDGVGVALIDTGVAPVAGLHGSGQVINGPDLSFDSQSPATTNVDGFGHGTHMAGLIAGHDEAATSLLTGTDLHDPALFQGMAPDAHIVNVKAGASDGSVDVSQVIAALDWVVENKASHNIRVINLSYGTDSTQSRRLDPLAHAVQNAWRAGIVVVVAAGNDGDSGPRPLNMPAIDPYVIAVGSADNNGYGDLTAWTQGSWTNSGDAHRRPDILAPGKSAVSLRVPGSAIDTAFPEGRVYGDNSGRFFRGTGTSMSTAVVSGAVALLLQAKPSLTPDQVKGLLMNTGVVLGTADDPVEVRALDIRRAVERAIDPLNTVPSYNQRHPRSSGLGSLDESRGSSHLYDPATSTELQGEQDVFGVTWDAKSWAEDSAAATAWVGGVWRGTQWTGDGWSDGQWQSVAWVPPAWSGIAWLDRVWVRNNLSEDLLSAARVTWQGTDDWSRVSWSSDDWKRVSWSSGHW